VTVTGAVSRPRPVAEPRLRLFVFHHAGGSHHTYRPLARALPADWEVCLVDAPGRGRLGHEKPLEDPAALVARVLDELLLWLDRPYAFFGHSMGALLAHGLTLRIRDAGLPLPRWLGMSARGVPRPDGGGVRRHLLPSAELRRTVGLLGGTPDAVLGDDVLWALVEPVLRADLKVTETWGPAAREPLPPVPLSVLGGRDDPLVSPDRLAAWAGLSPAFLGLRLLPGHHFYLSERPQETAAVIAAEARRALAGAADAGPRPSGAREPTALEAW
jgi:surfactin synthase thioesterase subunit